MDDPTLEKTPLWMGLGPLVASTSHELTVVEALSHTEEEELAGARVAVTTPFVSVVTVSTRDVGMALSADEAVAEGTIWEDSADSVIQGYEC